MPVYCRGQQLSVCVLRECKRSAHCYDVWDGHLLKSALSPFTWGDFDPHLYTVSCVHRVFRFKNYSNDC